MYICDCHCDTLTKDYAQGESLYSSNHHVDIKRIIENGGGLQFFAICLPSEYRYQGGIKFVLQMIDRYNQELKNLQEKKIDFLKVKGKKDLEALGQHQVALLLSIEDGGAIEDSLEALRIFYQLGVRCMSLTWNYRNQLADGVNDSSTGGGLTQLGREVVKEMNSLGMLIDVSHLAPQGFWDVINLTEKPVMATHSNAYTICRNPRNLTDEQIKAIAENNGVIGINFYSKFLEDQEETADIHSIYKHIEHIISLVGDEHVALGTDFDGVKNLAQGVLGTESMPQVLEYLRQKGYQEATIEKIAYRNVVRILKEVLA